MHEKFGEDKVLKKCINNSLLALFMSFWGCLFFACGEEKPDPGVGNTPFIIGNWNGSLLNTSGSAEGGSFSFKFEESELFTITRLADGGEASGKYNDFQVSKIVVMEVEESNISDFDKGVSLSFSYELKSNELLLSTQNRQFLLKRLELENKSTVDGQWYCVDKGSNNWHITVEAASFRLLITKGNGPGILMKGAIEEGDKGTVTFRVHETKPENNVAFLRGSTFTEAHSMSLV